MQHVPRSGLKEWRYLQDRAVAIKARHLGVFAHDSARAAGLRMRAGPLFIDFSKQKLDAPVCAGLINLAETVGLRQAVNALMAGDKINNTEGRAALHTALRLPRESALFVDGLDIVPAVHQSLDKVRDIVSRIHSRQWRGFSGRAITDVVNIGVGGSDLGPFMACQALGEYMPEAAASLKVHFVSSIDGTQLADLLGKLRPETTLFIISSKSFTTVDTLTNAHTALMWMLKTAGDEALVLAHHFIGVSAQRHRMTQWGIPPCNQVLFWDWVGGRFSLWSAIGLPVALKIGMANFEAMLAGAHFMDRHFQSQPLASNLPAMLGLVGAWNATFMNIRAHTILPYDGRLKFFPAYLTQLEMESNGKSVDRGGRAVDYATCPVLWGEVGPNAQHAFYQLLHQGTQAVSSDFIAPVRRYTGSSANPELQAQHRLALANCLAQTRVLMLGDASTDNAPDTPGFKRYQGNQPSTTILVDELSPYALGALVALYEHKVFVMSVIWDINPFDQWGVELGKKIADRMTEALAGAPAGDLDVSTRQLLEEIRNFHDHGSGGAA